MLARPPVRLSVRKIENIVLIKLVQNEFACVFGRNKNSIRRLKTNEIHLIQISNL